MGSEVRVFNYGFSKVDEKGLIAQACEATTNAKIACLLLPGIGLTDDLRDVHELGVGMARIATHCTEADISEQRHKDRKISGPGNYWLHDARPHE